MTGQSRAPRVSRRTIKRLSVYRRALSALPGSRTHVFSQDLAELCGSNAAQVRRDLMVLGSVGSPSRGYDVADLIRNIDEFFAAVSAHRVALVGVGTLGRSLIAYFQKRYHRLSIAALLDRDPELGGRVLYGLRCHPMEDLDRIVAEEGISIAVLALPDESAQEVADRLIAAGVAGILNFAPLTLRVPDEIVVENIDITAALDRLAFLTAGKQPKAAEQEEVQPC
jgi:redox-sensing transcriptional repressor